MLITFKHSYREYSIPIQYIDSFSYVGDVLTINFSKPLKITGFKRSEKVTFKSNDSKQILSKIQKGFASSKQN